MEKDFERWHRKKRWIHYQKARLIFQEREIWFCHVGVNIGFEEDGPGKEFLRPVVIFKKFDERTFLGIPLTRTERLGEYYITFTDGDGVSIAMLAQARVLDAKRLGYFSKVMPDDLFEKIEARFIEVFKSYPRPVHRLDICEAGEQAKPSEVLPKGQEDDPCHQDSKAEE